MKKKILVIVPAYNEEESIQAVISDIRTHLPDADICAVDDGSQDSTYNKILSTGINAIKHPYNLGIGGAMQTGFKFARENDYDIAVQIDGDGQHRADQAAKIIEPLERQEANVAIGSRYIEKTGYGSTFQRKVGSKIFSGILSLLTSQKVTDPTSGFRACDKSAIRHFAHDYPEDYPEPEAIVLLHKVGLTSLEVPVSMAERSGGKSSITPIRSVYYMIKVLLAIFIEALKKKENLKMHDKTQTAIIDEDEDKK